jgi:hypothetical protein
VIARDAEAAVNGEPGGGQRIIESLLESGVKAIVTSTNEVSGKNQIRIWEFTFLGVKVVKQPLTEKFGLLWPIGPKVQIGEVEKVMLHGCFYILVVRLIASLGTLSKSTAGKVRRPFWPPDCAVVEAVWLEGESDEEFCRLRIASVTSFVKNCCAILRHP